MDVAVTQAFFVPGPLPGLNEIIDARGSRGKMGTRGKRWDPYNEMKQRWAMAVRASSIGMMAMSQAWACFLHIEPSRKRDPDNVSAGGTKVILDALVECCLLGGDGWKHIQSPIVHYFCCDPNHAGVIVGLSEESEGAAEEAMLTLMARRGVKSGIKFVVEATA